MKRKGLSFEEKRREGGGSSREKGLTFFWAWIFLSKSWADSVGENGDFRHNKRTHCFARSAPSEKGNLVLSIAFWCLVPSF